MRVALVGTGYWGKNHARVWRELAERGVIEEVVICDADEARARAAAGTGPYVTNVRDVLQNPDITAIDLCTPTPSHFPLAEEAMRAGKDVFVEKPMTVTTRESDDLIRVAGETRRILQVGHIFRYHSGVQEARKLIHRGDFGRILYMTSNRQAFREPRPDMGVLHALGVHELDLFPWLLGVEYPEKLLATLASWHRPGIEETAHLHLEFKNGVHAHAFESWMSPTLGKDRHLTIVGSKMSLHLDYLKPQEIVVYDSHMDERDEGGGKVLIAVHEGSRTVPIPYQEPLEVELIDFVGAVKDRRQPLADMHSGRRAVRMVEACFESAREGRVVTF